MVAVDTGPGLHVGVEEFRSALSSNLSNFADVGLGELQLGRVDKAGLDEGASLALAFAVVYRIDEATVVA
jgi:hypothetical protein